MILFSQGIVATELAAGRALFYPRIGHQTLTKDLLASAVTASSEAAAGPRDAPLRPDTSSYWQPTALPATWEVDFGLTGTIDYVGIAGHTLGSSGCSIEARVAPDSDLDSYVTFPGTSGNNVTAPRDASTDIGGDIDLRVRVGLSDYTPPAIQSMLAKESATAGHRCYGFQVLTTGFLRFRFSSDGTNWVNADSTATLASAGVLDGTKIYLRATRAFSSGNVQFFVSNDAVTWTQLGTTVAAATGSILVSGLAANILGALAGTSLDPVGKIYWAEFRLGINGPAVLHFDAADAAVGDAASVLDGQSGLTWAVNKVGIPNTTLFLARVGTATAPGVDSPLAFLDTSRQARRLRLIISGGTTMPKIAAVFAGAALVMEKGVQLGFAPVAMARVTKRVQSLSRGGQFLGQGVRRMGINTDVAFQNLSETFAYGSFDAFCKSARTRPYFFMWNPQLFPQHVAYAWTEKDIVPAYSQIDRLSVGWNLQGIGYDG